MRKATPLLLVLALLAACATTPRGKAYQYTKTLTGINRTTATALDYDIIKVEEAVAVQAATRAATTDLKRAIAGINAGQPADVTERIFALVLASINEAQRLLAKRGVE